MKVLLSSFHLNGHRQEFHPQTQNNLNVKGLYSTVSLCHGVYIGAGDKYWEKTCAGLASHPKRSGGGEGRGSSEGE